VVTTYLRDKIDAHTAWQALAFSGRYTIDAVESPARSLALGRSRTVLEGSDLVVRPPRTGYRRRR